jgi:chemotaxis protein methyltransferase CheR
LTRVPFSDEEYRLFSEWLAGEFGIWFGPEKREILRARLEPRRAELGLGSYRDLFFHLKFHPHRGEERQRLIPLLTNNESFFLRERGQLDLLRDEVLPDLTKRLLSEGTRELRILSAGCAAGQEPYTLAMVAREYGLPNRRLDLSVTGLDLDPIVLERARRGRFTQNSFRGFPEELRDRYFSMTAGGEWEIDTRLRESVEFRSGNLAEPSWARDLPAQHIVFCRNVLIYFTPEATRIAAQGLHQSLHPGGYLFLGHAETLRRVPTPLVPERRIGVVFYRRSADDLTS